jgi:hypothetical protein
MIKFENGHGIVQFQIERSRAYKEQELLQHYTIKELHLMEYLIINLSHIVIHWQAIPKKKPVQGHNRTTQYGVPA